MGCYHIKSTGEMGCFTLNNITIQRGCNYECDDPKDCSNRDHTTVGNFPPLKNSDKKGKGDFAYALEIFVIAFGGLMEQSMVLFLPVLQDFGLLLELCVCVSVYINSSV